MEYSGATGTGHARRLVRFLRLLELAGETARLARLDDACAVVRHGQREFAFPACLFAACERDGLVARRADALSLRPEGLARLRRLQFPDMAFQAQHAEFSQRPAATPTGGETVLVNDAESPVQRLFARKDRSGRSYLSHAQFAAADRLRSDFERGRLQPRMSVGWDRTSAGRGRPVAAELSDFALDARRRVERALDSLEPSLAGVALDVCCFLKGLEQVERERRWPPRSAKLMLRTALSALARHYGLEGRAQGGGRGIVQWGDENYRPSL